MTKFIIVTGPSATGKTGLALQYAKMYDGELVNFDSRQIYKRLDIITGKDIKQNGLVTDSTDLTDLTKIWLYDLVDPKEYFSSFDYVKHAMTVIKDIIDRGKVPILVGGTYLYLYHLLYKIETENIPPNNDLRERLNVQTLIELQQKLQEIDSSLFKSLNQSDRNNPQRLIRKIEIAFFYRKTGVKVPTKMKYVFNEFFSDKTIEFIGLSYKNREDMLDAIKIRVDKRLKMGAVDEVRGLLAQGYNESDPGMKTIGYQQIIRYLKGKMTKQQAIEEWARKEFQYTKRQLTFMKKDPNIVWRYV